METFTQKTIGDNIFKVIQGSDDYESFEVTTLTKTSITCNKMGYRDSEQTFDRLDEKRVIFGKYNDRRDIYLFANETEAIRYCKSQMMKILFKKIDEAKKAIKKIHDYRNRNIELLNHDWTEKSIAKLEKTLGY